MENWLRWLNDALIVHPKSDEIKKSAALHQNCFDLQSKKHNEIVELQRVNAKLQAEVKRLEKYELFAWACPMCGNYDPNFFGVKRWASYGRAYEYRCLKCKWRSGTCIKEEDLLKALVVERVKRVKRGDKE